MADRPIICRRHKIPFINTPLRRGKKLRRCPFCVEEAKRRVDKERAMNWKNHRKTTAP